MQSMSIWAIAVAYLGNFLQAFLLILRHDVLIPREQHPGYRRVFFGIGVGHGVNVFFPARAGEVLKCLLLTQPKKEGKVTPLSVAGVLVADRVVDISTLSLMAIATRAYIQPPIQQWLRGLHVPWYWVAIVLTFVLALSLWFFFFRESTRRARRWGREFRSGLHCLGRPKWLAIAMVLAALSWGGELVSLIVLCSTQGFSLTLGNSVFVLIAISLVASMPVSFGNIGPYEAAGALVLVSLGLNYETALAVATVHHLVQLAAIATWTLIALLLRERPKRRTASSR